MSNDAPPQAALYRDATLRLRSALRRNKWDANIAARRTSRIYYIFDSNAFQFHINIKEKSNQLADIAQLLGVAIDDPLLTAMERLTSDYMFSGQLPRQSGNTGYISTQHFNEVVTQSYRIEKLVDLDVQTTEEVRRAEVESGQLQAILADERRPITDRLSQISKIVPAAWLHSLHARTHFNEAINAAFLAPHPRLTPLHYVPWGWDAGRPMKTEVDLWARALGPSTINRPRNRRQDALTLATIVDLYRNDRHARYDTRTHLYLFVTADHGIASAASRRAASLRGEGIPYFVRTPADFFPLLNINAMGRIYADRDAEHVARFAEFFEAIDVTLNWSDFDSSKGDVIPMGRRAARSIESLQDAWRGLSEIATLLNARYFEDANQTLFRGLTTFVSAASDASLASLRSSLGKVRETHVTAVLDHALLSAKQANDSVPGGLTRRVQFKPIGASLVQNYLGPRTTVAAFVDRAVARGSLDADTDRRIRSDPNSASAAVLVACLFLAAEEWDAAKEFTGQALLRIDQVGAPTAYAEGSYLRALSLRFSMKSESDFLKARRLLSANLTLDYEGASDEFAWRRLRDQIERGALSICAAVMQAILDSGQLPAALRPESGGFTPAGQALHFSTIGIVESELALAELMRDRFSGALSDPTSQWHELAESLRVQVVTNLAGAWVYHTALPGRLSAPIDTRDVILAKLREVVAVAAAERRPLRDGQFVYERLLTLLDVTEPETQREIVNAVLERLDVMAKREPAPPLNDAIRFEFLATWLRGRSAQAIPKQPPTPT